MDMMVLVVDVTKGLQTQTVECIVIGETAIASGADALVVLNKVRVRSEITTLRHSDLSRSIFLE